MSNLLTEPLMFDALEEEDVEEEGPSLMEVDYEQNLAGDLDDKALRDLGVYLTEAIEQDAEVRKSEWEAKAAEGLRRLNFTLDTQSEPDIPESDGSINARFPLIKEAATQFQARSMEEIYPPQGPVKTRLQGKKSKDRIARSARVSTYLNHCVTTKDPEWYKGDDRMMMMLPLLGCMFKRVSTNTQRKRVESRVVRGDSIIMPYNGTGIMEAPRWTYKFFEYSQNFLTKQKTGTYQNVDLVTKAGEISASDAEKSDLQEAIDLADGQDDHPTFTAMDFGYEMYESHVNLDLDSDSPWEPSEDMRPYMVFVEKSTQTVLGIFADWVDVSDQEDPIYERVQHMVQYDYLPGFGAYGFGLCHMIGDLDEAASELLMSIIDAGRFASAQGGLVSQQVAPKGMDVDIIPGVYKATDIAVEDLGKAFFTPDFKPPAPVLHNVLLLLIESGRSYTNTTEAMTGSATSTGPVGTMALLVEQGSKVYSGIHKRLHKAKEVEYKILFREIELHFVEEGYPYPLEDDEDPMIMIEDFDDDYDVIPVSDPNIASNQQRIALAQAAYQIAKDNPDIFDIEEASRRMLEALRVPDFESLYREDLGYDKPLDPASENAFILIGKIVKTHPDEHHIAHVAVHTQFLGSDLYEKLPEEAKQPLYVAMMSHIMFHHAYLYLESIGAPRVNLEDPNDEDATVFDATTEEVNMISEEQMQKMTPPGDMPEAPAPRPTPEQVAEQQKQQMFEADEERKQLSWEREEKRKQAEFVEEMKRDDQRQNLEDAKTRREMQRKAEEMQMNKAQTSVKEALA